MRKLRDAGLKTATISPFGERHSAFHWYAGFNEIFNTGKGGLERADEVAPLAIDWIKRNARADLFIANAEQRAYFQPLNAGPRSTA